MLTDLHAELQRIFRELFDDDELKVTRETSAADVDGWDSLMHIDLIIAVEASFGLRFATAEIANLKYEGQNVGAFLDVIEKKLNARG